MQIFPRVIDLSHYDDVQDGFAGAVRFGIWGVMNKASEAYGYKDASFDWRRAPAKAAGLLYGGYHFIRPGNVTNQVNWFLECIGDTVGMRLALDYEDAAVPESSARMFCQEINNRVGRWPAIYGGSVIKQYESEFAAHANFWRQIPLWLSHYNAHPSWPTSIWNAPWLWQYTGDGAGPGPHGVPGVLPSSQLDMNSYTGTHEQFIAQWAGTLLPPAVPHPFDMSGFESGRGSVYSQFDGIYHWHDDGDAPNSNALGVPDDCQGISFYDHRTLGKWFEIHTPNGHTSIEQQTDIGPAPWTGRKIDISAVCAERIGYSPDTFPTNGIFFWRPAPAPAQVADLPPRQQAIKWKEYRQSMAGPVA